MLWGLSTGLSSLPRKRDTSNLWHAVVSENQSSYHLWYTAMKQQLKCIFESLRGCCICHYGSNDNCKKSGIRQILYCILEPLENDKLSPQ